MTMFYPGEVDESKYQCDTVEDNKEFSTVYAKTMRDKAKNVRELRKQRALNLVLGNILFTANNGGTELEFAVDRFESNVDLDWVIKQLTERNFTVSRQKLPLLSISDPKLLIKWE